MIFKTLKRLPPARPLVSLVSALVTLALAVVVILREIVRPLRRQRSTSSPTAGVGRPAPVATPRPSGGTPTQRHGEPAPTPGSESPRVRTRRELLTLASIGLGGFAGAIVAVPVVGALVAPLTRQQAPEWRAVGPVSNFTVGDTVAVTFEDPSPLAWSGFASQTAAWLRRVNTGQFEAFEINCTHLGCPVRWLAQAHLFMCPCHGGVFYEDGSVAAGPPEKPLFLYPVRVRDGQVEIQSGPVRIV